jgi:sodium transport system ATP-binding protein
MIQVRQVTKRLGGFPAVRDLSFDAPDSAITGLLGANGAGKTTTLRMIAGVLTPDDGEIRVGGASPQADPAAAQRGLGALLDHTGLYPRLTARENLAYFARLRRLRGLLLEESVENVLGVLGLAELADRRAGGFSQGERMKVALGRVLIHGPAHLLLDEPTNGLDVPTVRMLRRLLTELRGAGACIVFSSHVLGEVESLCDRVVVIARGAVVAQGSIEELCNTTRAGSLEDAFVNLTEEVA